MDPLPFAFLPPHCRAQRNGLDVLQEATNILRRAGVAVGHSSPFKGTKESQQQHQQPHQQQQQQSIRPGTVGRTSTVPVGVMTATLAAGLGGRIKAAVGAPLYMVPDGAGVLTVRYRGMGVGRVVITCPCTEGEGLSCVLG